MVYYSDLVGIPNTDKSRWRLRTDELGRETWDYINESDIESDPQSEYVKYLLGTDDYNPKQLPKPETPYDAARNGATFLKTLQEDCGVFPCQYKGPMFMTIGYIATCYFTKTKIPEAERIELVRYIVNTAHPVDGGWGLHSVDKSTCFGTSINYVALRLLGLPANHPVCQRARKTLHRLGGAIANPHWGKAWLSVLNLYKWEGVNPAPPELWALPYSLPIHPGRWWVHTRAIYLPLGYLSAGKIHCELDPLLEAIRSEIYVKPFDSIDFTKQRNNVCGVDLYYPHTKLLDFANNILVAYEKYIRPNWFLKKIQNYTFELIKKEIANTDYLCIAPVNAHFNAIVTYVEKGGDSYEFKRFQERFKDVMFLGPQGLTVMGTNGSQVWDTAFAVQYFFMAGLDEFPEYHDMIEKGYKFLVRSQFTEECVPGSFRDKRKGAWPFSTKTQGYVVSDCTAEALKAIIMVRNSPHFQHLRDLIKEENLNEGIDVLLSLQNVDSFEYGSFATYEKIKATTLLEKLNPAEVFGNIMVEYPYVECTDSSVLGLTYFRKFSNYKRDTVTFAIDRAIDYIKKAQQEDGSWYGCWGICFTYASMFALEALNTVDENYKNSEVVRKGCDFLVSHQMEDGGWGESMKSCETHTYVDSEQSLVVQTAWVVIGLILADYPNKQVIDKGIKILMERQKETGEWCFEDVEGVFNHSCAIEYPNYKFLFPIKALGLYTKKYGNVPLEL
ncbi:lanosterol synthase [Wickerhamomyces ciferrii]|uniref:Terpene cyclase/mutase family member n=1 Tax=Wickerhamomyces ciferrii (strain ATCC 14091 / BCRC 22168 / CBS 111 / JCM 3599 / NBRC 0793 / NRRL Y-1031 F-60-10) TaxID=1206466 RepID=K0KT64_WICCF|nr:lanosterol synthase [Wickerhamomyces ciferrii]CCH45222.1 lanosterol synthase [Wickerhamomyces ciferrii]